MSEVAETRDSSELVFSRAGVWLLAFDTVAAGVFDLVWGGFDSAHQPIQAFGDNIPGCEVMAYITGVWMVTAGLALLWRRSARTGAVALALIYLIFTIFWLPRFYNAPKYLGFHIPVLVGVFAGFGSQLIVAVAGALLYVSPTRRDVLWSRTILVARWIFGICSIDFGLSHLTDIRANLFYVPKWTPFGQEFWVILTGICFVLAGLAILSAALDDLAARLLALMFLAFNVVALPQFIIAQPRDHVPWGGYAYNLAAVAASWILADALAKWHARPGGFQRSEA